MLERIDCGSFCRGTIVVVFGAVTVAMNSAAHDHTLYVQVA